ncbi:hypothetical protein LEP1GSC047_0008 [Leptospira inadai serovar Lyme str. 10]|uniref:Uncharacterized protein n=3 Tax=Leptospira inadai TaxID=29506 RepID=V6HDJ6_9LEPT|nr:hypothetical protein [Leptospira inadai]EQA38221.1 hypothetical protein LEP1GSC047_0008 [Leptospira inadai serovar Lyme str. 10]PNV71630.1 hypothetical protein BES34_021245 [Leptospira inadai serovar Lyme]
MKLLQQFLLIVILVLLGAVLYLGNLVMKTTKFEDTLEYTKGSGGTTVNSGKSLSYIILKRPKSAFGGYRYYFGAKLGNEDIPFVQKYSPILDSDKDKFDKIEDLADCGQDTYVLTLKTTERLSYLKFTVFDKLPELVDERTLKACKRGRR